MKKIQICLIYCVRWSKSETQTDDSLTVYFEYRVDADKVARLPLGWYGGGGYVSEERFDEDKLPTKLYASRKAYADDNLTPNQISKHLSLLA